MKRLLLHGQKKLNQGIVVISDRYMYSGIAYSLAKNDTLSKDWCTNCDKGLIIPDLIIFLDASNLTIENFKQRFDNVNTIERYEIFDFLILVNNNFKNLFNSLDYVSWLPSCGSKDILHEKIIELVNSLIIDGRKRQ